MKVVFITAVCLAGIAMIAFEIAGVPVTSGAPPKPAARTTSNTSFDESLPEIPAVPFLTLALVRDPSVHEELGLNPKQLDGVQSAIAEVDGPFWPLRDVPLNKCFIQLDALLAKLRRNLNRELTSSQLDRLDQIILQARGWKGLIAPEVADRLKLSEDQVSKLRKLLAEIASTGEEKEQGFASPSTGLETARTRLRKAETKRFTDVLSKRQQNEFSELLGKPFDLRRVTPVGCIAPELRDVAGWINTQPMTLKQLRGKVVVVHFWAFSCINCIRNLPHYQGWHERFGKSGLTIIGIQTPETAAERSLDNLKRHVIDRKIEYPVVFDAASENWKSWGNDVWPSVYLIDKRGRVRNWWYGELNWNGATGEEFFSKRIEALLAEE